jgi:hypothetical protein
MDRPPLDNRRIDVLGSAGIDHHFVPLPQPFGDLNHRSRGPFAAIRIDDDISDFHFAGEGPMTGDADCKKTAIQ